MISRIALLAALSASFCVLHTSCSMEVEISAPIPPKTISPEKIATILEKAQQAVSKAQARNAGATLLEKAREARKKREKADAATARARVERQNTVLASSGQKLPINLGVYKRDVIELGLAAGQVAVETLFYRRVQQSMVTHIVESIEKDCDNFLKLLEAVDKGFYSYDKWYDKASFVYKPFYSVGRSQMLAYLQSYIEKQHAYTISLNPFSSGIFFECLALMAATKTIDSLPSKLILPDRRSCSELLEPFVPGVKQGAEILESVMPDMNPNFRISVPRFFQQRYEKDAQGNLQPIPFMSAPFSVLPLVKIIASPRLFISKVVAQANTDMGAMLNDRFKLNLPKWLYSDVAGYVTDYMTLVFGARIFNANALHDWNTYVEKHLEKTTKLVKKYKQARDEKNELKMEKRRAKIKKFVLASYRDKSSSLVNQYMPCSLIGKWWQSTYQGRLQVDSLMALPIYALLIYKAGKFYNDNFAF